MPEKTCPPHEWRIIIKSGHGGATHYAMMWCPICKELRDTKEIERRLSTYEAVLEFIKYLYAGDLKEIDKRYDELPDEVKEAIESHPVYGGDDGTE